MGRDPQQRGQHKTAQHCSLPGDPHPPPRAKQPPVPRDKPCWVEGALLLGISIFLPLSTAGCLTGAPNHLAPPRLIPTPCAHGVTCPGVHGRSTGVSPSPSPSVGPVGHSQNTACVTAQRRTRASAGREISRGPGPERHSLAGGHVGMGTGMCCSGGSVWGHGTAPQGGDTPGLLQPGKGYTASER